MKLVILAGGYGTRISEETSLKPKPMVEIGGIPIIVHIMKIYAHYGIKDFIICGGYKVEVIKDYFTKYFLLESDFTVDLSSGEIIIKNHKKLDWKVTVVDTGRDSMTGSRIFRIKEFIEDDMFCVTYGDGVSDVDIKKLIETHRSHGKIGTLTAVLPSSRFGVLEIDENNLINNFKEKPVDVNGLINGGFFVFNKAIFDYIADETNTILEKEPLEKLARQGELVAFKHFGFWHPMDTLRDNRILNELWANNKAPWKVWKD